MLGRKLSSTSTLSWECSHDKASFNFLLCDWIFLLLIIWFWVQFGINLLEWVFQEAAISVQWLAPRETVSFASPKTNCFPHDLSLSVMPPSWKTVCSMLAGTQIYFCFKEYGLIMCDSKVQAVVSLGSWWVFSPRHITGSPPIENVFELGGIAKAAWVGVQWTSIFLHYRRRGFVRE